MSIADIRRSYDRSALDESAMANAPMVQLNNWLNDAIQSGINDATAMTLATADTTGRPSARIVLLKQCDDDGLVFFTNYESRKGRDLQANPQASALLYWSSLERQVRVEGRIALLPEAESDAYFQSRPLGSRISAWASPQSQPISYTALRSRVAQLQESLGDNPPRPAFWGGYRLLPDYVEFWQGRASRLNDRLVYRPQTDGSWRLERLAP